MADARPDIRAVFCEALDRKSPEELSRYLDAACGGDADLRAQVEELLASHREGGKFLGGASPSRCETLDRPLAEGPGAQIGPYKLLQEIGLGGMGVVYMADQKEPVKRRVALKIIKPGMDTRQVVARFEAERHALAMMDHPNIARVLDAGTTDSGRPYFVMELVNGIPVTQYCDEQHLTPRERLELFIPICQAVQHAHQKGIIHRDIKPSNILVALYDGRPVPKVIDFGVAKATSQTLTERTMFTQLGQIVGTLEYMSPEQAQRNQLDIDTRSDIYSLGVLLYELLTGETPFDRQRLRSAAWDEMLRIIREEEPPRPSLRLSSSQSLPSIAANRHIEPKKLSTLVRGELDWIVMKALEKDRGRRYETANGLANDIRRYLDDEPVVACPPSATYRFQKFARRNKGLLATAATITAVLLLGAAVSTWQAIRATSAEQLAEQRLVAEKQAHAEAVQSRDEAEKARQAEVQQRRTAEQAQAEEAKQRQAAVESQKEAEAARAHAESERQRAEANFAKARAAVDEYLNQVTENELLTVPGLQPLRRDLLTSAMKFYREFTQARSGDHTIQADLAAAHYRLGRIQSELGDAKGSKTALDEAIRLYESLRQQGDKSLSVQFGLAQGYFYARRHDDAVKLCEEILAADAQHAETRELLAEAYNSLAVDPKKRPSQEMALQYHQKALALREGLVKEHPDEPKYLSALGGTVNNIGVLLDGQGKQRDALAMFESAVGYWTAAHEKAPQSILGGRALALGLGNVAHTQAQFGLKDEALKSFRRQVEVRQKLAFQNPAVPSLRVDLYKTYIAFGAYQRQLGDTVEANRSFRAAQDVLENIPHDTADELFELAAIYASLAAPADKPAGMPQADAKESEERAKLAIETLRKAISADYRNVEVIKQHKLLDPIRERPEFKDIVASLEKTVDAENLAKRESKDEKQQLTDKQEAARLLRELAEKEPAEVRHQATLAASLRSIGLIQLGQKNYTEAEKSLNEALRIRESLKDKLPNDPSQELGHVAVRIALGQLRWETDRRPEAHRLWQECLSDLEKITAAHRDDVRLQQAIADQERTVCGRYGDLGLWELASQYALRNVRLRRITDPETDSYSSVSLLALGKTAEFAEFCRQYEQYYAKSGPWIDWHKGCLVWHSSLAEHPSVPVERLVEIGKSLKPQPGQNQGWFPFPLAMALYRHRRHAEALDILVKNSWGSGDSSAGKHSAIWVCSAYLRAMLHHALKQPEPANQAFAAAEADYRRICRDTLDSDAVELPAPVRQNWWWLIYIQQLRGQATRTLQGRDAPDDPWQRLIQARGYWLIGEKERAEAELAATDAAAAKEPELCLARARLFDRFGQPERAEAEWQKVVDNAGKDPMPWIHRGRWYAERGDHQKADADFAKVESLKPDDPTVWLLRELRLSRVLRLWHFARDNDGWQPTNHCTAAHSDGVLSVTTTGDDPYMICHVDAPPGWKVLTFCARVQGADNAELYWGNSQSWSFSEQQLKSFRLEDSGGKWKVYRVVFQPTADLKSLRLDPGNCSGLQIDLAWIVLSARVDRTEADWQRVVDYAGKDPMPWIERGRWYAERGEHTKADADFAKAASLAPDELNKFLEAGWWVVGPYPPNLEEFCPPELEPDPSKPVYVIDPKTGLSEQPSPWVSVPSGPEGTVSLSGVPARRDGSSIYALGHVYSPTERAVMLMIRRDQALRVWVNGELIEHRVPGEYPIFPTYDPHRLPIVLHGGRNTILVKSANPDFAVRIGDTLRDRAIWLAEQRRFAEAAQFLGKSPSSVSDIRAGRLPCWIGSVLAMEKDVATSYERLCDSFAPIQSPDLGQKFVIFFVCSQRPNAIFDKHAEQLVSFVEEYTAQPSLAWARQYAPLVNYRAKHYERARSLLQQIGPTPDALLPLRSLLEHQAGDVAAARKSLEQAIAAGSEYEEKLRTSDRSSFKEPASSWEWWYDWAQYLTLLAEAEQTIRGGTTASEKLKRQAEETMAKRWAESPETAPYDHAVLFSAIGPDGMLKFPQPLIARGKRLAQLKRFDAAEADFNKAVELKPNDPDVLAARGVFYADRGQPDKAAADFHAALNLFTDESKPRWALGVAIDLEAARRDDVFDRLVALRPNDEFPCKARVAIRVQQGRLEATIADAQRLERLGKFDVPAAVALLRGDREEFERIRGATPLDPNTFYAAVLLGLAPTSGSMTSQLLALAERQWQQDPQSPQRRRWWGVAQLRAGRLKEAVETLECSLHPSYQWQEDADVWPLLAIAHHQLGSAKVARKWLDQTTQWIALGEKVPAAHPSVMMGPTKMLPWDWLYARVFYREAKELIEGKSGAAGGKPQVAAGAKLEPARAAKPETKPADPPAAKPPAPQPAPNEKPEEKEEQKK